MNITNKFKIETGLPMPIRGKYPWRQMNVGDSFFVPNINGNVMGTLIASAHRRLSGARFSQRAVDGGVRIWRIA